jgi:hypothetical protein
MSKILFFLPEAAITPHFLTMVKTAEMLRQFGNDIIFLKCNVMQTRCVVMDSQNDRAWNSENCKICQQNADYVIGLHGFKQVNLEAKSMEKVASLVGDLLTKKDGVATLTSENVRLGEFQVGQITRGQHYLINKRNKNDTLGLPEFSYLNDALVNNLYLNMEIKRIINEQNIDKIVVFCEYGQNLSAISAAISSGLDWMIFDHANHLGPNPSLFSARRFVSYVERNKEQDRNRARISGKFPNEKLALEVLRDIDFRLSGKSWYNKGSIDGQKICKLLKITEGYSKVVGLFTSSIDEFDAAEMKTKVLDEPGIDFKVYEDQSQWLSATMKFAEKNPDTFIIVRIHPREGSDARTKTASSNLPKLIELFSKTPGNMQVFFPNDEISSYDIVPIIDFAIVSWSSIALECGRLGVPVISPFYENPNYSNNSEFIRLCKSESEYLELLSNFKSEASPSELFALIKNSLMEYCVQNFMTSIDVSRVIRNDVSSFAPSLFDESEFKEICDFVENMDQHQVKNSYPEAWLADSPDAVIMYVGYLIDLLNRLGFSDDVLMIRRLKRLLVSHYQG